MDLGGCAHSPPVQHTEIPKQVIKGVLIEANKRRFTQEIQAEFNKWDNSRWFGIVVDRMHADLLTEYGYGDDLLWALDQLYSARWRFREDEEMMRFFKTLVHVQMDFTADGPVQHGDLAPSVPLQHLDGSCTSLQTFMDDAQAANRPLVIFAGSWT